jgi:hypothetical protein
MMLIICVFFSPPYIHLCFNKRRHLHQPPLRYNPPLHTLP